MLKENEIKLSFLIGIVSQIIWWILFKPVSGHSLAVQWLGLCDLTAEGPGSIPGQGTKIPQAAQRGQKTNKQKLVSAPDGTLIQQLVTGSHTAVAERVDFSLSQQLCTLGILLREPPSPSGSVTFVCHLCLRGRRKGGGYSLSLLRHVVSSLVPLARI